MLKINFINTTYPYFKSNPAYLPIDRNIFIDGIKNELFEGKLSERQLESINLILDECESQGVGELRQIAFIFATAYHFTYNPFKLDQQRLTPAIERGASFTLKGASYYPYFSRGYCTIRGKHLYRSECERTGHALLYDPDLLLTPSIASNSIVYGMKNGIYFGRRLDQFISGKMADYNKASRIVGDIKNRFLVSKSAVRFEYWLRKSAIDI